MGQEKEKKSEKPISPFVKEILSEMKENQDPCLRNGGTEDEIVDILSKTEDIFRTFLADKNEAPFIEFIDSDPEISLFLTKRRFIPKDSIEAKDSILSYMRKRLEWERE